MNEHSTDRDPLGRHNFPTGIPGAKQALLESLERYVRGFMQPDAATRQIDADELLKAITSLQNPADREDALRTGYAFAISTCNQLALIPDPLADTPHQEGQLTAAEEAVIDELLELLEIDPVTGHINAGELMLQAEGKPAHVQHEVLIQVVRRSNENSRQLRGRAISDDEVRQIINVGLDQTTGRIDPDQLTVEMNRLSLTNGDRATVLDAALRTSLEQTQAAPEEDPHGPVLDNVDEVLTAAVQSHEHVSGKTEGTDDPDPFRPGHALALVATLLGLNELTLTHETIGNRPGLRLEIDDVCYVLWTDSNNKPRLTAKVNNTEVAVLTQEIDLDPATGLPSPNGMMALLGLYDMGTPEQHHRLVGQATKDVHDAIYGNDCQACAEADVRRPRIPQLGIIGDSSHRTVGVTGVLTIMATDPAKLLDHAKNDGSGTPEQDS